MIRMSVGIEAQVILTRIETKLDTALSDLEDHEIRIRNVESNNHIDHESRLRKLERALWLSAGAAAAAGGGIGASLSAVLNLGR